LVSLCQLVCIYTWFRQETSGKQGRWYCWN